VIIAPPGEDGFAAVGDGTPTETGRYVFICGIPVGADPQAYLDAADEGEGPPDVDGGPRTSSKGWSPRLGSSSR
jgi:hypothetical protein